MRLTDDEAALAREAVACPRWRWMEGMQSRPLAAAGMSIYGGRSVRVSADWSPGVGWLPDLDDPATVGCLEALVQAALGHDGVNIVVGVRWSPASQHRVTRWTRNGSGWGWTPHTIGGNDHPTKIAALVAALRAAP